MKADETSVLNCISKYWGERQKDRFARLQHPRCSENFFRKVITVVKMAPTLQARALAIRKPNNIVYSRFSNPRSNVTSDKWKHDTPKTGSTWPNILMTSARTSSLITICRGWTYTSRRRVTEIDRFRRNRHHQNIKFN